MRRAYIKAKREMLTVQVLFLGPHHFMRGCFADGSGHSRSRNAVLSSCDAICQRLTRHLRLMLTLLPLLQRQGGRAGGRGRGLGSRNTRKEGDFPGLMPGPGQAALLPAAWPFPTSNDEKKKKNPCPPPAFALPHRVVGSTGGGFRHCEGIKREMVQT